MSHSPSEIPEIPPPPAFTNDNDYEGDHSLQTAAIVDGNHEMILVPPISTTIVLRSPASLYQNCTPLSNWSLLRAQNTTRGQPSQINDWIGNLHFWKSLQNREGLDSLNLRDHRRESRDKKVGQHKVTNHLNLSSALRLL